MYADDLLISYRASTKNNNNLQKILHAYSSSAGQQINTAKSTIIHHPRLQPHHIQSLHQIFNMPTTSTPPIYLVVQFKHGRTSRHIFEPLLHKMARKDQGWMKKCLTPAGRLVLIKTSLTSTSNHLMQT